MFFARRTERGIKDQKERKETEYENIRHRFVDFCLQVMPPYMHEERRVLASKEFDEFCNNPAVVAVAVGADRAGRPIFVFGTRLICIPDKDDILREIGEFIVEIGENWYCVRNITRTIQNLPHPHVNEAGVFCMQTGYVQLETAVKQGRFAEAGHILLHALHTAGPGAAYAPADLKNWPVVKGG